MTLPELPLAVFVRGCARSGTTLLADIMNESESIGLLIEQPLGDLASHLLDVFWFEEHVLDTQSKIAAMKLAAAKARGSGEHFGLFENLDRMRFPRRYPTRDRLGAIITGIVAASLDKTQLKVVGSKTPGHWDNFELELIASSFPRVKYVFIVRNPMETVNSILNFRNLARAKLHIWPDKPVEEAIARYQEAICLLLSCVADFGDRCFVIKYDDLIADANGTLAALGDFLEIPLRDESKLVGPSSSARNVLTADEEAAVRSSFASAIEGWPSKRLTGLASAIGGSLDDCVRVVEPGKTYRCDAPVGDRGFLGSGWSGAEPPGIWSDAPRADLFFAVPRDGEYAIDLEFAGYIPSRREPLTVGVTFDGTRTEMRLRDRRRTHFRSTTRLAAGRVHHVRFDFDALRSPLERGLGRDRRRLGICLRRLKASTIGT
jgi:Sulfotransferase family